MTYYVAKSGKDCILPYICINSDCYYRWFHQLNQINPLDLDDTDPDTININQWLSDLTINGMTFLYSFTRESHPELFI